MSGAATLFMVARFAGHTVAIATEGVGSVVDVHDIVPVPLAPRVIRGIAALRSRVVTVIDPAVLIGAGAAGEGMRAIVITVEGHAYAVLIEEVDDIAPFVLRPVAPGVAPRAVWGDIATGMVERGGELILAIDPTRLIPALAAAA